MNFYRRIFQKTNLIAIFPKSNMDPDIFSFIDISPDLDMGPIAEYPLGLGMELARDYTWRFCVERNWQSLDSIPVILEKERQHRKMKLESTQEQKEGNKASLVVPGVYTKEERMAKIRKYKTKKKSKSQRPFEYTVRRIFAQSRPRVRGRFIKHYIDKR